MKKMKICQKMFQKFFLEGSLKEEQLKTVHDVVYSQESLVGDLLVHF